MHIPTIDIAPYLADPDSPEAAAVVAAVRDVCRTAGFFTLVGHGVPPALPDAVLEAGARLFARPLAEKQALRPPSAQLLNRGYEALGAQVLQAGTRPDLKEGFFVGLDVAVDDARAQRHPRLMGPNVFPDDDDADLKTTCEEYYAAVLAVARVVLRILARGLPYGDDVFAAFAADDPLCNLRLLHYPREEDDDNEDKPGVPPRLGAGAHTDFGAITLLYQDAAGGLEVLDPDTQEDWIDVPPRAGAFVVNIGDMLALWTRSAYRSNVHRVRNRSGRDRYSAAFFFDGSLDVRLAPLDGSSSSDGGEGEVTVAEHMLARLDRSFALARDQ